MVAERRTRGGAFVAAAMGLYPFLLYLPAITMWFVSDDSLILARVQQAGGLAHPLAFFQLGFYREFYRPLAFLSQATDWAIWGSNAAAFHFTNVCVHAANTILVYVLGRRFMDAPGAAIASLLFGLHPSNQEAVFWISGRFDLLATFFGLLALIWFFRDDTRSYVAGLACFSLALLSKESALAVPVIAVAHDVIVKGRSWQTSLKRLLPLLLLLVIYAALRAEAAGLAPAGETRRLGKLVMMAAALGALLWAAWTLRDRLGALDRPAAAASAAALALLTGLTLAALAAWPVTERAVQKELAFVGFAAFNLVSPIAVQALPPYFLDVSTPAYWFAGLVTAMLLVFVAVRTASWLIRHLPALFLAAFGVAALIPVSSMTGPTRYLYLASAATSLLVGYAWRHLAASWRWRRPVMTMVLVVSASQILLAARDWRWISTMSRDGVALMSSQMPPCGTRRVILLTAPAELRGMDANFNKDSLRAVGACDWSHLDTILRVEWQDVSVSVSRVADDDIRISVPNYRGNLGSYDLSLLGIVPRGRRAAFDAAMGRVETAPDGDAQVFHIRLVPEARQAVLFYYSDGRINAVR